MDNNRGFYAMSNVRISTEDKEILTDLCERYNMHQGVVIGYLLEQAIKFEMFDPQWIDHLTKVAFHDLLLEADVDYRRGFEIAKYKATLNLRATLIKEMIKAMPIDERVAYLKESLGDPKNGVDLLENMSMHQMYTVNGEKRMCPPGQDGRPRLVGVPPSQLVTCPRGWHLKHDPCLGCNMARTCEIVFDEQVDWLALHGTTEEQEKFIAQSRRRLN